MRKVPDAMQRRLVTSRTQEYELRSSRRLRRNHSIPSSTGDFRAFRCAQLAKASWRTKWTRSLILLKDPRDRKGFSITLDTMYMDSCGIAINIIFIISSNSIINYNYQELVLKDWARCESDVMPTSVPGSI